MDIRTKKADALKASQLVEKASESWLFRVKNGIIEEERTQKKRDKNAK